MIKYINEAFYNLIHHKFYLIPFLVYLIFIYLKCLIIAINKKEGVSFHIVKILAAFLIVIAILRK